MKIAFQGLAGAYSDMVARELFPQAATLPCAAFEDAFQAVAGGDADRAVIPVENSTAGRVADVHHLLPEAGLHIIAEHFQPIHHCLLGMRGATIADVKNVFSHVQGLSQCRQYLRTKQLTPVQHSDTAGAARDVAYWKSPMNAAIASQLAAEIYGLDILDSPINDTLHNTTRFLVLSRDAIRPAVATPCITSLVFDARSVPAALYKNLGGFATNGINLTKIESYMLAGAFQAVRFYIDCEGHPDSPAMQHALEELRFFSHNVMILGVYAAAGFRSCASD